MKQRLLLFKLGEAQKSYLMHNRQFQTSHKEILDTVEQFDDRLQAYQDCGTCTVIIGDCLADVEELEQICEAFTHFHQNIRYILWITEHSQERHMEKKYCLSHGLCWVPPALTFEEGGQQLKAALLTKGHSNKAKQGHIIAFQGVTPNIGTTVVSFVSALMLAEQSTDRIGYLCLNLKSSKLQHYTGEDSSAALHQLRAELKARSLTPEDLDHICAAIKGKSGLRVLYGNTLREQAEYYSFEDIQFLLDISRQAFDLTFVEVNAYWDNAATLCSMRQADSRILVCSDRTASYQADYVHWYRKLATLLAIGAESTDLFVARQNARTEGAALRHIRKFTGHHVIGSMTRHEMVEQYLDQGRLIELAEEYRPLREELQNIVRWMERTYTVSPRHPVISSQRSLLQRWFTLQTNK